MAFGQQDGSRRLAGDGVQERGVEAGRDVRELVGAARAAPTSPAASMISLQAAKTLDRVSQSGASSSTRRAASAAASSWPCSNRSRGQAGLWVRPHWLAWR